MITPMKESQVSLLCSIKETIFCVLSMATLFQVRLFYDVEQQFVAFSTQAASDTTMNLYETGD